MKKESGRRIGRRMAVLTAAALVALAGAIPARAQQKIRDRKSVV